MERKLLGMPARKNDRKAARSKEGNRNVSNVKVTQTHQANTPPGTDRSMARLAKSVQSLKRQNKELRTIAKLKQLEEAWRKSEERYRGVVEDQTEAISRFRADGTFTFVNKVYCRFFNKKSRELIGKKWHPRAVAEDRPKIQEQLNKLAPSNPVVVIENRVRIGKRGVRWMQFINRGFFDSKGRLVEIQSVGRDISDLKQAEQILRDREARYHALFHHSMAGILLTAPDGRIFSANPAACRMLGRTERSICRLGRAGLIDREDPRVLPLLRDRAKNGYAVGEINFMRADGTRLPVQIASEIFESVDGLRTSMVFQDISAMKSAEQQIHAFSRNLLALREEEKRHLSAVLHHEVGSATVGVTACLGAVEAHLKKGDTATALTTLEECRKLFADAVKQLKSLAIELRPPDLDLLGLHAALNQHFRRITHELSLKIDFVDSIRSIEISPEIQTFLFRTTQECLNNAIQHAEAHRVRVRLSAPGRWIRLSIKDDGRGFARDWNSQNPDMHLGLRSIQEWVGGFGGKMDVVSKPGAGTEVTVRIPKESSGRRK